MKGWGYSLDRRQSKTELIYRDKQPNTFTCTGNKESQILLESLSLDWGGKPEHQNETHAHTRRTCKLHSAGCPVQPETLFTLRQITFAPSQLEHFAGNHCEDELKRLGVNGIYERSPEKQKFELETLTWNFKFNVAGRIGQSLLNKHQTVTALRAMRWFLQRLLEMTKKTWWGTGLSVSFTLWNLCASLCMR